MDKLTQGGGHRASTSIGALLSGMGGVRPVSMEVPTPVKLKTKHSRYIMHSSDFGDIGAKYSRDKMDSSDLGDIGAMAEKLGWSTEGWGEKEEHSGCKKGVFNDSNDENNKPAQSGHSDTVEYDEENDAEWFRQEEIKLSEEYGGDFIRVKYIECGNRVGYYCELCLAEMNAKVSLDSHCLGMKHLKRKNMWEKNQSNKKGGNGSGPCGYGQGNNWRGKNEGPSGRVSGPIGRGRRGGGTKNYDQSPYTSDPYRPDREEQYARDGHDHNYDSYDRGSDNPYAYDSRVDRSQRDDTYSRIGFADLSHRDDPYARDGKDDVYRRGRYCSYPKRRDDTGRLGGYPEDILYPSQHHGHLDDRHQFPPRTRLGSSDERGPSQPRTLVTPPPQPNISPPPATSRQAIMMQMIANCSIIDEEDVELGTNVICSLIKSLKAYHIGYGQPNLASFLTEAESNMNTIKTLCVGKKVLGRGQGMGHMPSPLLNEGTKGMGHMPSPLLNEGTSASSYPEVGRSSTKPPVMDDLLEIGDNY